MEPTALQSTALDHFRLRAASRRGPFELIDASGAPIGSVTGDPSLRLHAAVFDRDGEVVVQSRPPEIFGQAPDTAPLIDGTGAVIGAVAKAGAHHFREQWVMTNPVDEPVVVIEEQGQIPALLASWRWPTPRRFGISLPAVDLDGVIIPGRTIGEARRTARGRRWRVDFSDDGGHIAGIAMLATFAVIAVDHTA
jgi:hypothetical protein